MGSYPRRGSITIPDSISSSMVPVLVMVVDVTNVIVEV